MSVSDPDEVEVSAAKEIQTLYRELALRPEKDFGWEVGKGNARRLGYAKSWLDRFPIRLWESTAAVGNPFSLGRITRGETVVDLGCGAGADVCIAALLVGTQGRVVGIDITPAMVKKAQQNVRLIGLANVEIYEADTASLPLTSACADVVISNGAINLSQRKACVFAEIFRILRPRGRLQFADMVLEQSVESDDAQSRSSWADCVAGTVEPKHYLKMLQDTGFKEVEHVSFTNYRTAATTVGATFRASKPL